MHHYELKNNQYYLIDDRLNEIISINDEIALAFSYDEQEKTAVLFKHGNPERVKKWVDKARKSYIDAGLLDMANEIKIISGKINIHELNKVISICDYIGKLYRKYESRMG